MSNDLDYKVLSDEEHVLQRPNMYLGDITNRLYSDIWALENNKIVMKNIEYSEGPIRLFIEAMSNAMDNIWRSKEEGIVCEYIKIEVKDGYISVKNDGKAIPIKKHKTITDKYIPEIIFGMLRSSSNYDDTEERRTSGLNGAGIKLCNIFSSEFSIELNNPESKKYKQVWTKNMSKKDNPVLSKPAKKPYTLVKFKPELSRFGMTEFTPELLSVLEKTILDYTLIASYNKVKVYYNDKLQNIKSILDYAKLYFKEPNEEFLELESPGCKAIVTPFIGVTNISFVNGQSTAEGGVHVIAYQEALFRPIVEKINGKKVENSIAPKINIGHVKNHLTIFLTAELVNPTFKSQNKTYLTNPSPKDIEIKDKYIKTLMGWNFITKIKEGLKEKEYAVLKDIGKTKKGEIVRLEGLIDANLAGKKESSKCILCITEGLSARGYVIGGMKYGLDGVKGNDYIGAMAIRGKILNVRKATIDEIHNNQEIKAILKALGIEPGVDYTIEKNYKKLRYGKLYVIGDADKDGSHIVALVYNVIHKLVPSLLKLNFFHFMRTPIVKIKKPKKSFLFQWESEKFLKENKVTPKNIKYYKGLGTISESEYKDDFGRYPTHILHDKKGDSMLDNIFGDNNETFRKNWIQNYTQAEIIREVEDYKVEDIKVTNFINKELIEYSKESCRRSIASVLDGHKEVQRKVMFAAMKAKLNNSMKVCQFANYVAKESCYLHDETAISKTIIKMAQSFTGANNIPLFVAEGNFGSRAENGMDAAAPRYIYTYLEKITKFLYKNSDEDYLEDRHEEGELIEKEYYFPILPMILINGAMGVGTGYSTFIPQYNPLELIRFIRHWLLANTFPEDELLPHYKGFKGEIYTLGGKVYSKGVFQVRDDDYVDITEIPIGSVSLSKYKDFLMDLLEEKKLEDVKIYGETFRIKTSENFILNHKNLKLIKSISTSNMYAFDKNNKLIKYKNINEILEYYCKERLALYEVRRLGEIKKYKANLLVLENKIRFIREIDSKKLVIFDRKEEDIHTEMRENGYFEGENFGYLFSMQARSLNIKSAVFAKLEKEFTDLAEEIKALEKISASELWLKELNEIPVELLK